MIMTPFTSRAKQKYSNKIYTIIISQERASQPNTPSPDCFGMR